MNNSVLKKDKAYKKRQLVRGSLSVLISLALIIAVIGVNVLVNKIPASYTKIDVSGDDLYTIGEKSKLAAQNLDCDVMIYLLSETGAEDDSLIEFIGRYQSVNSKISFKHIDTALYPDFGSKYTDEELSQNSVIVESKYRSVAIDYSEIYVQSFSSWESYYSGQPDTMNFEGENKLTYALNYVGSEKIPVTYMLSGHGESKISETVTELVSNAGVDLKELSLISTSEIPEDATTLIINAPTKDLSKNEISEINNFASRGGNIMLFTDCENSDLSNIGTLTETYGVESVPGILIEGDSGMYAKNSHYLLPDICEHDITSPFIDKYNVLMPLSHGIKEISTENNANVTPLLQTSELSFIKEIEGLNTLTKEDGDVEGPFYTGIASELKNENGTVSKFVWISSDTLLDDDLNAKNPIVNYDLFINSINWLCEKNENISIDSKSMNADFITVSERSSFTLGFVIIFILPVVCTVAGIWIWNERKKK